MDLSVMAAGWSCPYPGFGGFPWLPFRRLSWITGVAHCDCWCRSVAA